MSSNFLNDENKSDIVIYQSESGETKIDVRFQDETCLADTGAAL